MYPRAPAITIWHLLSFQLARNWDGAIQSGAWRYRQKRRPMRRLSARSRFAGRLPRTTQVHVRVGAFRDQVGPGAARAD